MADNGDGNFGERSGYDAEEELEALRTIYGDDMEVSDEQ